MEIEHLVERLNAADKNSRLDALRELAQKYKAGEIKQPPFVDNVNNHIHTTYSFSPYSPTKAVYMAWSSGLATAGIMDHDSVGGAEEFIEAGKIIGLPVTVGFECRVSVHGTSLEGKRINNPDQKSVAYLAMHGVPHQMIDETESFLAPYRAKRNERNRLMLDKLNKYLAPYEIKLDFDLDVLPLSEYASSGSVTERHLLYALSSAIAENDLHRYFLLGLFKAQLVKNFYVDAEEELPHISDFMSLAEKIGAVPAYPYLGDVGVSATGDKKTQTFEDSYLDELMEFLAKIGMRAVTYMPARNTMEQLKRVMSLCESYGFFQISGEDINSPFQKFICEKIETPEFEHLIESAWALIGHEIAAGQDLTNSMFSKKTMSSMPNLNDRIKQYAELARKQVL